MGYKIRDWHELACAIPYLMTTRQTYLFMSRDGMVNLIGAQGHTIGWPAR